ncbi:hypothetical protein ACH4D5_24420 [Streptomyces sp. NPDC018029]|uniref:hypothetical protein n=1 Tax=Streptomyces sp. NPDC018029 TaxID=3365032 RepID=UPI00378C11D3
MTGVRLDRVVAGYRKRPSPGPIDTDLFLGCMSCSLLGRAAQLCLVRAHAYCVLGLPAGIVGFRARVADRS